MNNDIQKTDFSDIQDALLENLLIVDDVFKNMNRLLPSEYLQVAIMINDMGEKLKPMYINACLNGRIKKNDENKTTKRV